MGLLDNLERGLEKAVRSAFSAGGARAVQPVEIAAALRHAMDDESLALSEGHTVAPNDFTVHFSPADFERARTWGATLASELCDEVIRHAQTQGYSLPGAVRVAFHADDDVRPGRIEVDAHLDDGSPRPSASRTAPAGAHADAAPAPARSDAAPAPRRASAPTTPAPPAAPAAPAAPERSRTAPSPRRPPIPATARGGARAAAPQPTMVMPREDAPPRAATPRPGRPAAPAVPALEFEGRVHPISGEDMVLGRSPERADLVVSDSSVSRQHLRLVRVGQTVTLIDLGSRNGVQVNGARVDGSTVLRQGDRITVGRTDMVFHAHAPAGRSLT